MKSAPVISSDSLERIADPASRFHAGVPVVPKRRDHEKRVSRAAAARCHAWRQRLHGHLHLIALEHVLARTHLPAEGIGFSIMARRPPRHPQHF